MGADPLAQPLDGLAELIESMRANEAALLDLIRKSNEQVAELGDGLLALSNRIGSNYGVTRPLLVTKAAMLTSTCVDCQNEYVSEPGPPLCGPCWVRHGAPAEWPTPRASRA